MAVLILVTALALSSTAAYYSIVGLMTIFAALPISVAIMGSILEVAKLVTASWLYNYWARIPMFLKVYMSGAVVILMVVTSLGIFGYLSKGHSDQNLISGDVLSRIAVYDEKLKIAKENIESNRKQLKQMNEAVDQVMGRTDDERGAEKANNIRRSQQRDRVALGKDIEVNQKIIVSLNDQAAPIRAELRKVEADVGPLKYIAKFIYGDKFDQNLLEKAVTFVIILLVIVFDPLAVLLVIAGSMTWRWANNEIVIRPKREEPTAAIAKVIADVKPEPSAVANELARVEGNDKGEPPNKSEPIMCYKCGTELIDAPGIGPFCPNKKCNVIDGPFAEDSKPVAFTIQMPGTIGSASVIFKEEKKEFTFEDIVPKEEPVVESPTISALAEEVKEPIVEFAPPGTPGEAWAMPLESEQQPIEKFDKVYKVSTEELAMKNRGRSWFSAVFPKKDN